MEWRKSRRFDTTTRYKLQIDAPCQLSPKRESRPRASSAVSYAHSNYGGGGGGGKHVRARLQYALPSWPKCDQLYHTVKPNCRSSTLDFGCHGMRSMSSLARIHRSIHGQICILPKQQFCLTYRAITTSLRHAQDDKQQLKVRNDKLKQVDDGPEAPGVSSIKSDLIKANEPPDEDNDIPKEHVFQKLTKRRLSKSILTLEEGARPSQDLFRLNWDKYYKYQSLAENLGNFEYALRSYENEHSVCFQFPDVTDLFVVGGGLIGSATAYYFKHMASRSGDVCVIDKDPYGPHNCTAISNGLISTQSRSEDNVRVAQLTKELIRDLKHDVVCTEDDFARINYRPVTHLVLYREHQAEDAIEAAKMQALNNCYNEPKLPDQAEKTFPFLKLVDSDVALVSYGNQDEALVDPIALRNLYRTLAQAYGANFLKAEAVDFNMIYRRASTEIDPLAAGAMIARIDSGELKHVHYSSTLLCLGHNTPFLESQVEMENYHRDAFEDLHFLQPRLRLIFTFTSMAAPVINFPFITDTDGGQLMCEDFAGSFKYYANQEDSEKLFEENCDKFMDANSDQPYPNLFHKDKNMEIYFEQVIKPKIVKRIPVMEDAKFLFAQSGFEDYNTHDGHPIVCTHPYFVQIYISGGYGNRLTNYAPVVGLALTENFIGDFYSTYDVTRYAWDRVLKGATIQDFPQLLGKSE